MSLSQREIARYLGYGTAPLPAQVVHYAQQCEAELTAAVTPRSLGRRLSRSLFAGQSGDVDHHLRHCQEAILYAVTLGAEADRLLRRWGAQNMAKAAVGQAVCASWLDALCADYCATLLPELEPGVFLTAPFSPGYGDWPLEAQRQVLSFLDAPRRLGLTLTTGGMLAPEKSVTALVGLSDRPEEHCGQRCMRCNKSDCPFRAGT